MESVYHIVTIRVNETSWAHVWRLRSRYLGTGYDSAQDPEAYDSPNTWITVLRAYLKDNILPDEHVSTERIVCVTKRYMMVEGDLYQRSTNDILMQCIIREEGCELLIEVHGGECSNHTSCMLVGKALWHGFYWPTMI
jgi:hypothetical protein